MASPDYYRCGTWMREGPGEDLVRLDCGHVIDALGLGYWTGSALAHIWRAGRKPGETALEAIRNARGCLDREIARLEGES